MRPELIRKGRSLDTKAALPAEADTLRADLQAEVILRQMSGQNSEIYEAVQAVLLDPLSDPSEIRRRQDAVKDALKQKDVILEISRLCAEEEELRRRNWRINPEHISGAFGSAKSYLRMYTGCLKKLRQIADENIQKFESEAFLSFFRSLQEEITDDYLKEITDTLNRLDISDGTWIEAGFGDLLQSAGYRLLFRNDGFQFLKLRTAPAVRFFVSDPVIADDMKKRSDRALADTADVLIRAASHLISYFRILRRETAFFCGCINLAEAMDTYGFPYCFPDLSGQSAVSGMYDLTLAFTSHSLPVANDLKTDASLIIITGANQGGKSTFLRSLGLVQLMTQCGLFVPASSASVPVFSGIFTHFKKEEDDSMESGRLDEELKRMSGIIDHIKPHSLLLMNESFSSTGEKEGSEIAADIVSALLERDCTVVTVTHLFTFSSMFRSHEDVLFLKAERLADEKRTFRILPGEAETTAYGEDLYKEIFHNEL